MGPGVITSRTLASMSVPPGIVVDCVVPLLSPTRPPPHYSPAARECEFMITKTFIPSPGGKPFAIMKPGSSAIFVVWLRWVQHDAPAEQGEAGAAVHLALDHLDLVDGALDPPRAVGEGEPVDDRFLVVADPGGERAELGLVVGFRRGEPLIEAGAAGEVLHP